MSYYLKKTWDKTAQAYNSSVSATSSIISSTKGTWATGSGSNSSSSLTTKSDTQKPIFGVALSKLPRRSPELPPDVPLVVQMCVNYLMTKDERLRTEGLFRISGSSSKIEQLKNQFDTHNYPSLNELEVTDTHAISGLLKLYFRSLPEPLLTYDLYTCFVACGASDANDVVITSLRAALKMLPTINLRLIIYLCRLLVAVVQQKQYNKMSSINIALVFSPALLRAPKPMEDEEKEDDPFENAVRGLEDMKEANRLMEVMITHFDEVFEGLEEESEKEKSKQQEVLSDKTLSQESGSESGSGTGSGGSSPANRNSTEKSPQQSKSGNGGSSELKSSGRKGSPV